MEKWKSDSAKVLYNFSQLFLVIGVIGLAAGIISLYNFITGYMQMISIIVCPSGIITGISSILSSFILNGFAQLINETIAIREGIDFLNQSNKPLPNKNPEIKETYNSDLPDL